MLYLSGAINTLLQDIPNTGVMVTPNMKQEPPVWAGPWAADTGCYTEKVKFDLDRYLGWLVRMWKHRERNLFVTAPDVVGDAAATWERSKDVLPILRQMGYKAAFIAQDGLVVEEVDPETFDVLFLGGTNDFKLGDYVREVVMPWALENGKPVHMGRVNSRKRLRYADQIGCVTADGTYLAFGPKVNAPKLRSWLVEVNQPKLLGQSA